MPYDRAMIRRSPVIGVLAAAALLACCAGPESETPAAPPVAAIETNDMDTVPSTPAVETRDQIPPIDRDAPATFATATFALG
jgi:hypothetical protein